MGKGVNIAKTNAYAVLNSLVSRVSQVSLTVPLEINDANRVSQVAESPIIESQADVRVSQVTLALVIPSTYYPPDEYQEPYPCTVIVDRVTGEYNCFSRIPKEVACVERIDSGYICVDRVDKEIACLAREITECVGLDRSCEDE